jgi:hypothetical protein
VNGKTAWATYVALGAITFALVVAMAAIAILQVIYHQPFSEPNVLAGALTAAITALFGQGLFLGHSQAMAVVTDALAASTPATTPSGPTGTPTSHSGASSTPSSGSAATTPASPAGPINQQLGAGSA